MFTKNLKIILTKPSFVNVSNEFLVNIDEKVRKKPNQ